MTKATFALTVWKHRLALPEKNSNFLYFEGHSMPQLHVRWVYEVDCMADVTTRKGSQPCLSEASLTSVATAIRLFSS